MVEFKAWMERFIEDTKEHAAELRHTAQDHYFAGALFAMERALEEFTKQQQREAIEYFRAKRERENEPDCPF